LESSAEMRYASRAVAVGTMLVESSVMAGKSDGRKGSRLEMNAFETEGTDREEEELVPRT